MGNSRAVDLKASVLAEGGFTTLQTIDVGAQVEAALGAELPDDLAESLLYTLIVDDSGSISYAKNTQTVVDGVNLIINALQQSKQADAIQLQIWLLNGRLHMPFTFIKDVQPFGSGYQPSGGTPLFEMATQALTTVVLKTEENSNYGVPTRTASFLITDGEDTGYSRHRTTVKSLIDQMLLNPEMHIVGGMGISDGHTDFQHVFSSIGIPDQWILTPDNTPSEIRRAFEVASKSAVQVSQAAGQSIGGFGD